MGFMASFGLVRTVLCAPRLGYLCAFAENASAVSLSITHRGTASRDYHPPLLGPGNDWLFAKPGREIECNR